MKKLWWKGIKSYPAIIFLFICLFLLFSCEKLPYIPDENASIFLEAIPSIIKSGETALINIRGEKGNGYPLPDGTIVYLTASVGTIADQVILNNGQAEATYTSPDDFSGEAEIWARSGHAKIVPEVLKITVQGNIKPVADFIYSPTNPKSGDSIKFSAMASYDPDGTIVRYEWDFGDGGSAEGI